MLSFATPSLEATGVAHLEGLRGPAKIIRDAEGIPHILTLYRNDAYFLLGYVHAEDRFFQLDFLRRNFDGTLAELFGQGALTSDAQIRMFNLGSVAQQTWSQMEPQTKSWLEAYSAGVNAWLDTHPAPDEYAVLELTEAGIRPWHPTDTIVLMKGLAFSWFDLGDIDRTLAYQTYVGAGTAQGFDGDSLFHEDIFRLAPVVAERTVQEGAAFAAPGGPGEAGAGDVGQGGADNGLPASADESSRAGLTNQAGASALGHLHPEVLEQAREFRDRIRGIPLLEPNLEAGQNGKGSNWWMIDGSLSESGAPLLANDGHQVLGMPPLVYETHLMVGSGWIQNLSGKTFPGLPVMVSGCNRRICWGATNGALDLTDVFQEEVIVDPVTGEPTHTVFQGQQEPVTVVEQQYFANQIGDGVSDNLSEITLAPLSGGKVFLVPRRLNGPLLTFAPGFGLSVQFTGWAVNQDLEAFRQLHRSWNLSSFQDALKAGDGFAFNFGYADVYGNIAYFLSGELPLRDDLQNLGRAEGLPPYMIRDGTGQLRNEWLPATDSDPDRSLPHAILPFEEMPHQINPDSGYLVSANNDPVGASFDNDVLNQLRPGGGVLYLNRSYASGFRAAMVREMLEAELAANGSISTADFQRIQSNNQLLDAALLLPHLQRALDAAALPGAPPELVAAAADPRVQEAVARFATWDLSTPTGIGEGYDPGDDPNNLEPPPPEEIAASVATTIFSLWRSQLVEVVVDGTLGRIGLGGALPPDRQALVALFGLLDGFASHQGFGASGADFFFVDGVTDREAARDIVLLRCLSNTLDMLASSSFHGAFQGSTNQQDYRWGLLHRILLNHPLGGPFNVPSVGTGFQALSPELPGLPKAGGLNTVDVAANGVRARSENDFMFSLAPGGRLVASVERWNIEALQIVPGGVGGSPQQETYTNQLGRWLTNRYSQAHIQIWDVLRNAETREIFVPAH